MNRVVREHYPVGQLPQDLREGLDEGVTVRVVVEVEDRPKAEAAVGLPGFDELAPSPLRPMTVEDLITAIAEYRKTHPERVTADEAVMRIRELRDEWDD